MESNSRLIEQFINEFAEAKKLIQKLTADYSKEKFETRPAEGKWSAAECIEHINTTNKKYYINIKDSLSNNKNSNFSHKEYKPRFLVSKFINMMKPGAKMKFKAPRVFMSNYNGDLENTIKDFIKLQDEFITLAEQSRNYDMSKTKTTSPVIKFFKLQLGEAFMVIIEHQKRHLLQAENALRKSV